MKKKYIFAVTAIIAIFVFLLLENGASVKIQKVQKNKEAVRETEVFVDVVPMKKTVKMEQTNITQEVSQKADEAKDKQEEGDLAGELPNIAANYRTFVGFKRYSHEMAELGCRFFIMDGLTKKLLEINLANRSLRPVNMKSIIGENYSPRSRSITDEPALNSYLNRASGEFGFSSSEVLMLVPKRVEKTILKEINQKIDNPSDIVSLKGDYQLNNGVMVLVLNSIYREKGAEATNVTLRLN